MTKMLSNSSGTPVVLQPESDSNSRSTGEFRRCILAAWSCENAFGCQPMSFEVVSSAQALTVSNREMPFNTTCLASPTCLRKFSTSGNKNLAKPHQTIYIPTANKRN
ncbi:hypothetical protein GPALN_003788 [Globodera pallida]|nr:hypothetical protein GPALN_003788 [Globodera pallida]